MACDTYAVTLVVPGCLAFISPTKMGVGTTPASSPPILVLCEVMQCHVVGWPLAVCQGLSAVTSNQGPGSRLQPRLLRAWVLVLSHSRRGSQLQLGEAAACVHIFDDSLIEYKEARTAMGGIVWFHGGICVVDGFMAVPAP